jgi:hypothetical protein
LRKQVATACGLRRRSRASSRLVWSALRASSRGARVVGRYGSLQRVVSAPGLLVEPGCGVAEQGAECESEQQGRSAPDEQHDRDDRHDCLPWVEVRLGGCALGRVVSTGACLTDIGPGARGTCCVDSRNRYCPTPRTCSHQSMSHPQARTVAGARPRLAQIPQTGDRPPATARSTAREPKVCNPDSRFEPRVGALCLRPDWALFAPALPMRSISSFLVHARASIRRASDCRWP